LVSGYLRREPRSSCSSLYRCWTPARACAKDHRDCVQLTRTQKTSQYAMMLSQYLRRLYSLDTLDTRFTNSSPRQRRIDPIKPSASEVGCKSAGGNGVGQNETPPVPWFSKWWTPEFLVYGVMILSAVFLMVKNAYDISLRRYSLQSID